MVVVDLNQRLQHSLLVFYLKNRGFRVETRETIRPADWPATILITDKLSGAASMPAYGYHIWLVDAKKQELDYLPPYVKGVITYDSDLNELETCISQVLLRQVYISPGLTNQPSKRMHQPRFRVVVS